MTVPRRDAAKAVLNLGAHHTPAPRPCLVFPIPDYYGFSSTPALLPPASAWLRNWWAKRNRPLCSTYHLRSLQFRQTRPSALASSFAVKFLVPPSRRVKVNR